MPSFGRMTVRYRSRCPDDLGLRERLRTLAQKCNKSVTTPCDFCGSGRDQLQIHRPVFLPCEPQRVRQESDKLCDTVNEIELLEFRECGKSIKHVV